MKEKACHASTIIENDGELLEALSKKNHF